MIGRCRKVRIIERSDFKKICFRSYYNPADPSSRGWRQGFVSHWEFDTNDALAISWAPNPRPTDVAQMILDTKKFFRHLQSMKFNLNQFVSDFWLATPEQLEQGFLGSYRFLVKLWNESANFAEYEGQIAKPLAAMFNEQQARLRRLGLKSEVEVVELKEAELISFDILPYTVDISHWAFKWIPLKRFRFFVYFISCFFKVETVPVKLRLHVRLLTKEKTSIKINENWRSRYEESNEHLLCNPEAQWKEHSLIFETLLQGLWAVRDPDHYTKQLHISNLNLCISSFPPRAPNPGFPADLFEAMGREDASDEREQQQQEEHYK